MTSRFIVDSVNVYTCSNVLYVFLSYAFVLFWFCQAKRKAQEKKEADEKRRLELENRAKVQMRCEAIWLQDDLIWLDMTSRYDFETVYVLCDHERPWNGMMHFMNVRIFSRQIISYKH